MQNTPNRLGLQEEDLTVNREEILSMEDEVRFVIRAGQAGDLSVTEALRASTNRPIIGGLLRKRYQEYVQKMKKNSPRILLVGDSGLGKSNLVNTVFGFHPNQGGAAVQAGGRPCTKNFDEYGPTDFAPVRIIDSKGIEKISVMAQMEELRSYIAVASASRSDLNHVHLCWYFVGERWQEADKMVVAELMKTCGVIIILSKRDQRTDEWVENTRHAIAEDMDSIAVAEVGDPRGTRNWIPDSCEFGHGGEFIFPNMRSKIWSCQYELGTNAESGDPVFCGSRGDDSPYGHSALVHLSVNLLPMYLRTSFMAAQRVDLSLKHKMAAGVICGFAASAAGIGACPVPFADLPVLMALEAAMAATLIAVYGIPIDSICAQQMIGVQSGAVGVGSAIGYLSAQLLKGIPGLGIAGTVIDSSIAGTSVATLGIAMSVVLTRYLSTDTVDPEDARRMIGIVANSIDTGTVLRAMTSNRGPSSTDEQSFARIIEENVVEDRFGES